MNDTTSSSVASGRTGRDGNSPGNRTENQPVRFTLPPTDGTTGPEWIRRLGIEEGDTVAQILRSPKFKPTRGVVYEVAVLESRLFDYQARDRIAEIIRAEAEALGLSTPNAEIACLIYGNFSAKEFRELNGGRGDVVVMHEPVEVEHKNKLYHDNLFIRAQNGRLRLFSVYVEGLCMPYLFVASQTAVG
jgi:hypothetical protein